MKYASEVIELMGAHPDRSFRMMEIVNYAIGKDKTRKEREAGRKAITRVLKVMEDGGSLTHIRSTQGRGGYSLYQLKTKPCTYYDRQIPDRAKEWEGKYGEISHEMVERIRKETKDAGFLDPLRAFQAHKNRAKRRGVGFKMTFAEWWGLWQHKYHLRGVGASALCMCRNDDKGAYEVGNVYIATQSQNVRDYQKSEKQKTDLESLHARRKAEFQKLIDEAGERHSFGPPKLTYRQTVARLKLGLPLE